MLKKLPSDKINGTKSALFFLLRAPTPHSFTCFSLSGFSFTDTGDSQDRREGRGPSFIPLYHFHPLTNIQTHILQLCTWDDYHIFVIALLAFTRLLLDQIYHLIELLFDGLMVWCWFLFIYLLILWL